MNAENSRADMGIRVSLRLLGFTEKSIQCLFNSLPADRKERELFLQDALNAPPDLIRRVNEITVNVSNIHGSNIYEY